MTSLEENVFYLPPELREKIYKFVVCACARKAEFKEELLQQYLRRHIIAYTNVALFRDCNKGMALIRKLHRDVREREDLSQSQKHRMLRKVEVTFNHLDRRLSNVWQFSIADMTPDDINEMIRAVEICGHSLRFTHYMNRVPQMETVDDTLKYFEYPICSGHIICRQLKSVYMIAQIVGVACHLSPSYSIEEAEEILQVNGTPIFTIEGQL